MRRVIAIALFATLPALALAQAPPSPVFTNITLQGSLTGTQTGTGTQLPSLFALSRTETAPVQGPGGPAVGNMRMNLNFADGGALAYGLFSTQVDINGDPVTHVGPTGDAYPIYALLNDNALRSLVSDTGIGLSQDVAISSHVIKTAPAGGIPVDRRMRDEWNWWSDYYTPNLPSSQGGDDVVYEYDFFGNGLDDASIRPLEQTPINLNLPLSSGGMPMSFSSGYSIFSTNPDVWGHDWESFGGNFSHSVIDLFYATNHVSNITSATPSSPVRSVTVDDIMPLESGGSSAGPDFPVVSTAAHLTTATASSTGLTVTLADIAFPLGPQTFIYDLTTNSIASGTRVTSVAGKVVTLPSVVTVNSGDTIMLSNGVKSVKINGHPYTVAGVTLAGTGTHAGTVYFTTAIPIADAAVNSEIYPNANAIWMCSGSATAPWCDIAFDATGTGTLRSDGANGIAATGTGFQLPNFAFSALPATGISGKEVFCTNCLKPGESAGGGTGMPVFDDGHGHWVSTAGTVAAS